MTPLAQAIANALTDPKKRGVPMLQPSSHQFVFKLLEARCFDVTAVKEMASDLGSNMLLSGKRGATLAFLPAPITFIEHTEQLTTLSGTALSGGRMGWMLIESPDKISAEVYQFVRPNVTEEVRGAYLGKMCFEERLGFVASESVLKSPQYEGAANFTFGGLFGFLAMINTPRVVSRREHPPHVGLQRKLAAYHGVPGKFPLHPWSEIVLEVSPPASDNGEYAPRLTGAKALHFCRAHLRIRLGRLEMVSAHWRGDATLGIKPSRYRVVPKRSDVAA